MTLSAGVKNKPPSHTLHVEDKKRVLRLATGSKTHNPPLNPVLREGGANFERKGKNDPQVLADQRGSCQHLNEIFKHSNRHEERK